jgi:crossover junction endodeoxyribonuclease RuvC
MNAILPFAMIVLGIDPGIAITGYALVKDDHGKQTLIHAQAITTHKDSPLPDRLLSLYSGIQSIIKEFKPESASLEKLFFNTNVTTALIVGQARGVIQLALTQADIPTAEYTPLEVKMALTGYGRADKNQIQSMVKQILKLPEILKPDDVADAAAIAITHCFSYKSLEIRSTKPPMSFRVKRGISQLV